MIEDELLRAINTGATIEISYTNNHAITTTRKLSDIQYSSEYGNTYINAYCHTHKEQRTFKISRISSVKFHSDSCIDATNAKHTKSNQPYIFNPNKRIYLLFGENFNY